MERFGAQRINVLCQDRKRACHPKDRQRLYGESAGGISPVDSFTARMHSRQAARTKLGPKALLTGMGDKFSRQI